MKKNNRFIAIIIFLMISFSSFAQMLENKDSVWKYSYKNIIRYNFSSALLFGFDKAIILGYERLGTPPELFY